VACLYLALRLLMSRYERPCWWYRPDHVHGVAHRAGFWPVLFILRAACWLASCFPNRHVPGQTVLQQCWQRVTQRATP
jgi:hypothetical protein